MEETPVVNDAETTAVASTPTEQTATDTQPVEQQQTAEEANKYVPYERFKEVNDELKAFRQEMQTRLPKQEEAKGDPAIEQAKQALKQLGYAPKEELLAEVKQQLQREREDIEMSQTLKSLEGKYDGKDGLPKFSRAKVVDYAIKNGIPNPEAAYKIMHEKEIIDARIQQAIAGSRGTRSEGSDGSGSANAGTTNDDLKTAIGRGDKNALSTYLKRIAKANLSKS